VAEVRLLPGWPKVGLVKQVRRLLWLYTRSRPKDTDTNWKLAWEWADACRARSEVSNLTNRKWPWPEANEIATQYLILSLASMRDDKSLRLPFRAEHAMPVSVSLRLTQSSTAADEMPRLSFHSGAMSGAES